MDMKRSTSPVGVDNNDWLLAVGREASMVVAAWGTHGDYNMRADGVKRLFMEAGISLHHLGLTQGGHPKHPLYLRADTQPISF
jgi:hypothetical protein